MVGLVGAKAGGAIEGRPWPIADGSTGRDEGAEPISRRTPPIHMNAASGTRLTGASTVTGTSILVDPPLPSLTSTVKRSAPTYRAAGRYT